MQAEDDPEGLVVRVETVQKMWCRLDKKAAPEPWWVNSTITLLDDDSERCQYASEAFGGE